MAAIFLPIQWFRVGRRSDPRYSITGHSNILHFSRDIGKTTAGEDNFASLTWNMVKHWKFSEKIWRHKGSVSSNSFIALKKFLMRVPINHGDGLGMTVLKDHVQNTTNLAISLAVHNVTLLLIGPSAWAPITSIMYQVGVGTPLRGTDTDGLPSLRATPWSLTRMAYHVTWWPILIVWLVSLIRSVFG